MARRSAVSGFSFIWHGRSKIMVWHFSALKAGQLGMPRWLGLPVRGPAPQPKLANLPRW